MNDNTMKGQVAVVTGGGGGIGSAICRRLAVAGAQVVITYRSNGKRQRPALATLAGERHWVVQASVTDSAQMRGVAKEIEERYGRLDLLVNNAGITTPVPHDDLDKPN